MAFVYKSSATTGVAYHSELANAGPDSASAHARQRDAYILALAGSRDMRRLWADFEQECPALARLVKADVDSDRRRGAEVSRRLDERLREAELVTKARRPKVAKSARPKVTKASKRAADGLADYLASLLDSPDPVLRERARSALESRG